MIHSTSLRVKLAMVMGGLLTGIILLTGFVLYWSERRSLLHKMEDTQTALAESFVQSCRDALVVQDDLAALNASRTVGQSLGVMEAYCVDAKREIFAHSGTEHRPAEAAQPALDNVALGAGLEKYRWKEETRGALFALVKRAGADGSSRAVVVFSKDVLDQAVRAALRDVGQRMGLICSMALAFGVLGAFWIAQNLTQPIRRIAEGTRALARGELNHRINLSRQDELGQLAADFNSMAIRLGELDQMKNNFVSNVSHELRSPLSAITSYANLITDDWRNGRGDQLLDYVTIVRNNATRLEKFVNDILDLSKIDDEGGVLEKTSLPVRELFEEVINLFLPKAKEKSVQLGSAEIPADQFVEADLDKIRQVLINLIDNAIKFTPAGGRVTLSAQGGVPLEGQAYVRLAVQDTGPGISESDRDRIFSRFEQVKEMRSQVEGLKGTGLGLAIARGLVEAHGGAIRLESTLGHGSTFAVFLPEAP